MLYVVIAFLWISILLYLLLGGADFGAGIIELFTSKKNKIVTRKTLYTAIGPIWEANHMWLIIAIVILFVGFPEIYTTMSVHLHIPLTIMLLGIIARGTAFTFRHYDAVVDDMQNLYNPIFAWSSFVTPLFQMPAHSWMPTFSAGFTGFRWQLGFLLFLSADFSHQYTLSEKQTMKPIGYGLPIKPSFLI
jgi:cytochrome bd-type quinol oxidase subunit 2